MPCRRTTCGHELQELLSTLPYTPLGTCTSHITHLTSTNNLRLSELPCIAEHAENTALLNLLNILNNPKKISLQHHKIVSNPNTSSLLQHHRNPHTNCNHPLHRHLRTTSIVPQQPPTPRSISSSAGTAGTKHSAGTKHTAGIPRTTGTTRITDITGKSSFT